MRQLDEAPIHAVTKCDYKLARRILTLPHKTVGGILLALIVLLTTVQMVQATTNLLPLIVPEYVILLRNPALFTLCFIWVIPYTGAVHDKYFLGDCIDHITCTSHLLTSRREAKGVTKQIELPYSALYKVLETKDAFFFYDSVISAVVLHKADLQQGEAALLQEAILVQLEQAPPPKREVYRHM